MKKKNFDLKSKSPVINYKFKIDNSIGQKDISSVVKVMKTGVLSGFMATNNNLFRGGNQVKKFEKLWSNFFKVKYSVSVNSWTSGLIACIGALDLEPGDEVITTPWTMCATATAIIHWNCIPVFADIEKNTFCIDPKSVEKKISKKTKAILSVDIFGQSCDYTALNKIAKKYNLKLICDSAQSILAKYKNKYLGTFGDIGGYSLNYHKHINTGEGGVIVTNNKKYAEKLYAIRNHAEAIVDNKTSKKNLINMIGHNFRMGEIEAAIGIQQLKKAKKRVKSKQVIARELNKGLKDLKGLKIPEIRRHSTHSYYIYPMILDVKKLGVKREKIYKALKSEGVQGLIDNYILLHLYPMYQKKIAYGSKKFPWSLSKKTYLTKKEYAQLQKIFKKKLFWDYKFNFMILQKKILKKLYMLFKKFGAELIDYKNKKIIIVCNDAGCSQLISSWVKINNIQFSGIVTGPAENIFKEKKIKYKKIFDLKSIKKTDFVITGTSWKVKKKIIKSIILAKKYKRKIISFVDHWTNYDSRFLYKNKNFFPNEIWVVDKYAKKLAKKKFKNVKIKLIKNPLLAYLKKEKKKYGLIKNKFLIATSNFDESKKKIKNYKVSFNDKIYVIKLIKYINKNFKPKSISIKFHPSENILKYEKIIKKNCLTKIKIETGLDPIKILKKYSHVFGCETNILPMSKFLGLKTYNVYLKNKNMRVIPREFFARYIHI